MTDEVGWRDRLRVRVRWLWRGTLLLALLTIPWWGRALLRELSFFRVRRVVIEGTRYAAPDEIVSRLAVDTSVSIWDGVSPLVSRVEAHPQVRSARIRRRFPGTLVVEVTEHRPVALVSTPTGLTVADAMGRTLPVDPTVVDVDLPVVEGRDTLVLRVLGEVQEALPALHARVSEVRRVTADEVVFTLPSLRIRTAAAVSVQRLSEALAVQQDLVARARPALELDLRFRDQVVARFPNSP